MPEVLISGPEGRLQGRYMHGTSENAPMALVLHPNPEQGGTMNNKVVYTIYQSFVSRGFSTLRFNFRGVGRSQGKPDGGEGELSDAASCLDWLQLYNPNAPFCWVSGFSFGAWIGMQLLMRRPEIVGFLSVAPPASDYDFSFLAPCPSSGLMLQGQEDENISPESVKKLVEKLSAQRGIAIDYTLVPDADHFFTGKLDEMMKVIDNYLDANLPNGYERSND
ncbi:MAG: alpha/beta hydrolase [Rhodospirillaceae bacterium]|nr:alpha/beta hydrolase [Rhodospirillaceae bacterium]|tara:strand:+ start:327 stop:989 length:663 start_codon:yes stop_codon:yes gene_type:complete